MSYNEVTAERIRQVLSNRADVEEKNTIGGGLGFMVGGHLCCAVSSRGLTVRVGSAGKAETLAMPHAEPLRIGTRETAAFVLVHTEGYRTEAELRIWVEKGLSFVATL